MVQDRRLYQRLTPNSPQLILLDESKYSLLCDLSEGGVAVEGYTAKEVRRPVSLEFDMPEGSGCIHARAEAVWTSDSGHRTGFRFLDLPDTSRRQLRDWVSATSAVRMAAIDGEIATPTFPPLGQDFQSDSRSHKIEFSTFPVLQPGLPSKKGQLSEEKVDGGASKANGRQLASTFVAVIVVSSTAFLLGYYWRSGKPKQPVKLMASAPGPAAPVEKPSDSAASQPFGENNGAPMLSLDSPGFILQVGAMEQEQNADSLSDELRGKNFSTFVFHRAADRFYRVAVGPYPAEGTAIQVKRKLEQEGYKPILRSWTPE